MKSTSLNKQKEVPKTWSVEDLIVENALLQVDVHGKREIHLVPWGYMLNLASNVNTMLDKPFSQKLAFLKEFPIHDHESPLQMKNF